MTSILFIALLSLGYFDISARDIRVPTLRKPLESPSPSRTPKSLSDRGLLGNYTQLTSLEIVQNHNKVQNDFSKHINSTVIGFVTPWNSRGYEISVRYRQKLDIVCPVWYKIQYDTELALEGKEDIDEDWISKIRSKKLAEGEKKLHIPKITPRVHFETFTRDQYLKLITQEQLRQRFAKLVVDECKEHDYDGIFLDFGPLSFDGVQHEGISSQFIVRIVLELDAFFKEVGNALHANNYKLYISTAPTIVFQNAIPFVHPLAIQHALSIGTLDGVIVMCYDYSRSQGIPMSPLQYAIGSVRSFSMPPLEGSEVHNALVQIGLGDTYPAEHNKLFMGLNFYGVDTVSGQFVRHIRGIESEQEKKFRFTARDESFIGLISYYKTKWNWDDASKEHTFEYREADEEGGKSHISYYPTIKSIDIRVTEAQQEGFSIAIWELGQGLDYFMDLF